MDPLPEDDQRLKWKRPWEHEDDDPGAIPGSSRVADEEQRQDRSSGSMDDPVSECKQRIFLSHSGHDKDFVEELCGDLERCYRFPFFDKRSSSLPKGERFSELILGAARSCEVGVVVVSDGYFMSKWPMIELDAFVQTWLMQKELNMETKLKILPLFYGLSVVEFGQEERRAKWLSKWEDLAKEDPRIDVDRWKRSLGLLASFNGIVYNGGSGKKAYREEIVEQICSDVPPDVKWDDSHVQGGSRICQVIEEAISGIQRSERYGVRVVGVYGVGGMGKTTLCKSLGNRLSQKNHMKASHVELGSKSYGELLKEVLKVCTSINEVFVEGLDEGKCRDILLKEACKQKVFLAIDNVWLNSKSLEEARKFLRLGFHKESIVLVTSRALETLTSLGISSSDCFEMPCLDDEDARNLLLYHAGYRIQFPNENDRQAIKSCVGLCYFHKGNWNVGHYLPLALKALGIQVGCIGSCPSEWVKALPRVRDFNYLQEEENPVFSILRSSFDCLRPTQQTLLLDLVVFAPQLDGYGECGIGLMEWLALVHSESLHVIKIMVLELKERGLVEAVDMVAQEVYIHDVYREFAKLEAEGRLKDSTFKKRKWVSCVKTFPTELLEERGRWKNLTRFQIVGDDDHVDASLICVESVKWANCSNIVVLELRDVRGSLDLKGLRCLKSLLLFEVYQLEGLQNLTALCYLRWVCDFEYENPSRVYIQKFPPSLKILCLEGRFSLSTEAFDMCVNLATLRLMNCLVENLDLKNCSLLQNVDISGLVPYLEVVSDLSLCGLQDLVNLTHFSWTHVGRWGWDQDEDLNYIALWEKCHKRMQCQLPASIEVLHIEEVVLLRSDVLARCTKLSKLELHFCLVENLELRNCTALQSLSLELHRFEWPSSAVLDESLCNLQELRNLTELRLKSYIRFGKTVYKLDQLPTSLRVLEIYARVLLGFGAFNGCNDLTKLTLIESLEDREDYYNSEDYEDSEDIRRSYYKMGPLPVSLKVLETDVRMSFGPDTFARCINLTKLHLQKCWIKSLDFQNCSPLQSLTLRNIQLDLEGMSDLSICGLQNLRNLTDFRLECAGDVCKDFWCRMDQLPASLHVVEIEGNVLLTTGLLNRCINLTELKLRNFQAQSVDLKKCSSLATSELHGPLSGSLEGMLDCSLWGHQQLSNLTSFYWSGANNHDEFYYKVGQLPMVSLKILEIRTKVLLRSDVVARCTKLEYLVLENCHAEILDFSCCTSLYSVWLREVERLHTISGLSAASASLKFLVVNGCNNLEDFLELPDLVCLTRLRLLNLGGLRNLRLSCLSGLTKLEILNLRGSNVELREEDVCTLASSPYLKPVIASDNSRIDVVRRKLIRYADLKLEEENLGMLPIWTNEV